jgi:uncharacterized protein YfaS (alpha-2-macroglobulin family)/uncharacterized protein YecT (DUF1311 family)
MKLFKNYGLSVILLVLLLLLHLTGKNSAASLFQASFDCVKASSPIETLICSDETLATLDRELGLLFTNARTALDGEADRLAHLKEQRAWLKSRLTTCQIPRSGKLLGDVPAMRECLIKEMRKRNEILTESLKKAAPEIKAEAAPFDSLVAAKVEELKISRITPKGDDVDKREQIVFQFNRPVVPIGKMDRDTGEIPIEIIPQAKCQWRWLNHSALACNLDKEDYLFLATQYKVNVKPGIIDENALTISTPVQHEFITARPRVLSSKPYDPPGIKVPDWDGPGIPVIDVRFNQQVTSSSVAQSLYIEAKGERYALKVTPSASSYQEKEVSVSLDKRNFWINTLQTRNDEPVQIQDHSEPARLNWIVRPQKALPEDTEYFLKVEPGLVSAFGPLRGIEDRIVAKGWTLPTFSFLGVECTNNDNQSVFIAVGDTKEKCSVFENVQLVFSAPVYGRQFTSADFLSPPMKYSSSVLDPLKELENSGHYCGSINHERSKHYKVSLPKVLKNSTLYTISLKGSSLEDKNNEECIKDVFDRCLPKDISASFSMDRYRPTFNWSGQSSVLEKDLQSDVSLYSANIDQATLEGETFTAQGGIAPMSQEIPLFAKLDSFERSSFGVKKLLANGSGIVSGEIKLQPEKATMEGRKDFFAQVTPFHVHAKVGEDSGLVWVTDLTSGKPVDGAEITVFEGSLFSKDEKTKKRDIATSKTNNKGVASIPGYNALTKNSTERYLSILVSKGKDLACLPLYSYEFSIYHRGSTSLSTRIATWGMTAEGVYRPGKEVDYKLYVRDMHTEGARLPEIRQYQLEIHDPKGAVVEKKDITLSEFGTYADKYATSKNGAAGKFKVYLRSEKPSLFLHAMDFLVTDYVPASFKVQTTLNQQVYKFEDTVGVDTTATLHSGGPFTDATNRYAATLYGKPFRSTYSATEEFWFGSPWCEPYDCQKYSLMNKDAQLDQEGKASTSFAADGREIGFGTMEVESAVEDDRGKKIANMAKAEYFGVDRFVGLKTENFVFAVGKPVKFRFVVTDGKGIPVEGVHVNIESSGQRYMAYVAKGAGNSFVTQAHTEQGVTDNNLQLLSGKTAGDFEMVFDSVGEHDLTVSIEDTKGRSHTTKIKLWVTGPDAISWGQNKDDALDFVTQKTSYAVGEKATILVKNPYPKAKALVTVERMGIVKSWVETLDSSLAPISFTVTEEMAPNFALSVVVFSPRVDIKQVDNSFDLGKPEWRMGYVQMEAKGKKHKFDFKINTDMETYRPGQEVHAKVQVTPRDGSGIGRRELTIAVLDEAVFDLIKGGMAYFDPQKGFYGTPIDSVQNYNILRKLVTHAPATPTMKGDDPGGDGAMADRMRSDLKSLAYWNPAVFTDETGKAEFSFKAPDNLTGWRILVLAADQNDHLDVGYKNIKVNRLTEIQPAMPNQVVEGDSFVAAFSVMNRTPDKRKIKVNISAQGTLADGAAKTVEEVEVGPFERKVAKIRLTAGKIPMDRTVESGQITLSVQAGDALDKDALAHQLVVNKKKNLDVGANYGTTSEAQVQEPLLFPENIRTDMGDVTLTLSPTLIGDLEGAFRFMKSYPYTCWEQKLSRAVMAANYQELKKYLSPDLTWDGSNGTIVEAIDSAKDFQAPNGGMGFFKKDNDRVDPYLSAYTALCFTMLEGLGYKTPKTVEEKLHGYLLEMLRTDVMPSYYSKGMASSVRAVALGALSRAKKIDTDMLKRHMEHLDQIDMFGKSQMLEAAIRLGNQEAIVETIADKILSSSNETGGRITFNESFDDGYNRILSSTPRTNCAVLSSLLLLSDSKKGAEQLQDLPYRLARTIRTMRGQKDHFENTQENLFCTSSLVDYSRRYEKVEPNMEVAVSYEGESLGNTRFASFQDKPLVVSHAINASDPGKRKVVVVDKKGEGRIYYATVMHYAPLADQENSVNAGMQITREYFVEDRSSGTWRLLGREDKIKRGDVVRVDLYLHLSAARTQIVVDDPIPGALEPVNTELATASQVDADKAKATYAGGSLWFQFRDWNEYNFSFWSFNHRELRHDAARFYAEYLPPGNYHLAYTAQAVAEGDFVTQPVFAGEMYDADIYGKGVSGSLHVDP